MLFDVVTLFPKLFDGYLQQSLLGKAIERGKVAIRLHDLRDWSSDKHRSVDDRPFGGGPGMVLMAPPVVECVESLQREGESGCVVLTTPQGERLCQTLVERLAEQRRLILLCGRYEGFDQRVIDLLQPEEVSIGDFVLNGGEVAAMVVIDAVVRLVPGVLGHEESSQDDSFSTRNRGLEYAQYTRPREYRGLEVPDILLSGNHEAIEAWRQQQIVEKTRRRRKDLLPLVEPPEKRST